MRHLLLGLLVLLMTLSIAEHRLSDGEPNGPADPIPPLWTQADHDGSHPPADCVMVTSTHRGNPYTLTAPDGGVRFDIDADGDLDQVSWTAPGADVAFIARDRNGDGVINNGSELIGNRTPRGGNTAPNALTVLAKEGSGGEPRGKMDSRNPLFFTLLLWTDVNHNGVSEADELRSAHHVLSAVGLGYQRHHQRDPHGNESRYRGFVHLRTAPGVNPVTTAEDDVSRTRPMYEVCLVTR